MTGSNLPPGCSVRDIPGNRPEEQAMEAAEEACINELGELCQSPEAYASVVEIAKTVLPLLSKAWNEGVEHGRREQAYESEEWNKP